MRNLKGLTCAVVAALAAMVWAPAGASAFTYSEAVGGDLSGDRNNPTHFTLSLGSNLLTSTQVRDEIDYVRLTLPAGLTLGQLKLNTYSGLDDRAFIAVQAGNTFTVASNTNNVAALLGYAHFGPGEGDVPGTTDLLPKIGQGDGAQGFTPPLSGSNYTFWIQQTGLNASTQTFDFVVVPEPGSGALLAAGALAATRRWRRRAAR